MPGPALRNIEALLTFGSILAATHHGLHSSLLENAEAPQNMQDIVETRLTSHAEISGLKDVAPSNMFAMLVTAPTSHPEMSALDDESSNILSMLTSNPDEALGNVQLERSEGDAYLNMRYMLVVLDKSQLARDPVKLMALSP
jgi:hypothetical protein